MEQETGLINFDKVIETAQREKAQNDHMAPPPTAVIGIGKNFVRPLMRWILLMGPFQHPSGLIARGLLNDPMEHCHIRPPLRTKLCAGQEVD